MHHPIPGDNVTVNSLKLLKKCNKEKVSSIYILILFFTLNKLIEEKSLICSSVSSNENNCVFT